MAVLPPIRRLVMEDYKAQQAWIGPLLLNLNAYMDATTIALNKSLTIADNTTGDVKTVTFSSMPSVNSPVSVPWTKRGTPRAILVGNVTLSSGADFTLSQAVQVQFAFLAPSTIQITNITGITPSSATQYVCQLIIFTG